MGYTWDYHAFLHHIWFNFTAMTPCIVNSFRYVFYDILKVYLNHDQVYLQSICLRHPHLLIDTMSLRAVCYVLAWDLLYSWTMDHACFAIPIYIYTLMICEFYALKVFCKCFL